MQPNLDLMRVLAVLLVLADHVAETIGYATGTDFHPYDWYLGRLAVLLFFVHIAYVLMGSMQRLGSSGLPLIRAFYVRRAFRIYPLVLVTLAAYLAFGVSPVPWETFRMPGTVDLASNALLTTNLTASPPVVGPMRALSVEVQMYLLLPLIFLFANRARDLRKLWAVYAATVVAAFALPELSERFAGAQYGPCFLAGIIAFAMCQRTQPSQPGARWPLFLAGVVAVYVAVEQMTPGVHHVALQAAICLAVGLGIPLFRQSGSALVNRGARLIARYSFGVYLFHCAALWAGYYRFGQPAIALVLLVVLPVAGYHLVEMPFKRLGARLQTL